MQKTLITVSLLAFLFSACHRYTDYSKTEWQEKALPEWEDPAVNTVNTMKPHATMVSFTDNTPALNAGWRESPNVFLLDGTWRFNYSPVPG